MENENLCVLVGSDDLSCCLFAFNRAITRVFAFFHFWLEVFVGFGWQYVWNRFPWRNHSREFDRVPPLPKTVQRMWYTQLFQLPLGTSNFHFNWMHFVSLRPDTSTACAHCFKCVRRFTLTPPFNIHLHYTFRIEWKCWRSFIFCQKFPENTRVACYISECRFLRPMNENFFA